MTRATLVALAALVATVGCAPIQRIVRYRDPLNANEHYQLAAAYEQKGELPAAEREYRAATRGNRKDLAAYIGLGNVTYAQGNRKDAEKAFRRALKISKDNAAASNNLAMLYAEQGRHLKRAEELARRASGDARFRPYALDTLATIYARQGRADEARAALAEARAAPPANDPAFLTHLDQTEQTLKVTPGSPEERADGKGGSE